MTPEDFQRWLKDRIEEEGGNESAVARKIGVQQPLVHRWASGENTPSLASISSAFKAFGYRLEAVSSSQRKGLPDERVIQGALKKVMQAFADIRDQIQYLAEHLPPDDPLRAEVISELQAHYKPQPPQPDPRQNIGFQTRFKQDSRKTETETPHPINFTRKSKENSTWPQTTCNRPQTPSVASSAIPSIAPGARDQPTAPMRFLIPSWPIQF